MREDMSKVLVESYRVFRKPNTSVKSARASKKNMTRHMTDDGEFEPRRSRGRFQLDETKMSMRPREGKRKEFGEHLNPLYRYIAQCVGRNWDEVYSEISRACRKNSTIGAHIYEHIWFAVEKNVFMVDGKPHTSYGPLSGSGLYNSFYIHPESKTLEKSPFIERPKFKKNLTLVKIDEHTWAVLHEEIWYEVHLIDAVKVTKTFRRKGPVTRYDPHTSTWTVVPIGEEVTEAQYDVPPGVDVRKWDHLMWFWDCIRGSNLHYDLHGRTIYGHGRQTGLGPTKLVSMIKTMSKKRKKQVLEPIIKEKYA